MLAGQETGNGTAAGWMARTGKILFLILLVKVILILFAQSCVELIPSNLGPYRVDNYQFRYLHGMFQTQLDHFDGQWYLELAINGYSCDAESFPARVTYAFFPLYPLLVRLAGLFLFFGRFGLAGVFVSCISSALAALLLYRMIRQDSDERTAELGTWYFLIYPAALFTVAVYSEGLFLLLSFACLYSARNHRWGLAGLFGLLTSLTRSQGILLLAPLGIEYLLYLKNLPVRGVREMFAKTRGNYLWLLLVPLGLPLFMLYSYWTAGDASLPMIVQDEFLRWSPDIRHIHTVLSETLKVFADLPLHAARESQIDTTFTLFFLALLPVVYWKLRLPYAVYATVLILFPLTSGSTMSMTRFLLLSFPHFWVLGMMGKKWPLFHALVSLVFILLLGVFVLRFVNGYWVN